jgi:CRISPR/Cas system CSM-associated protein Csm5 (group 7 of RAMP superfamily)
MHVFVRIKGTVRTAILWIVTRFNLTYFTNDMEDTMFRLRHGTEEAWVESLACPCGIRG